MNLTEFSPQNVPTRSPSVATLAASSGGKITINKALAMMASATDQHTVKLLQDQENGAWYVTFSRAQDGFSLQTDTTGNLYFRNKFLAGQLQNGAKSVKFQATKGKEYAGYLLYQLTPIQ